MKASDWQSLIEYLSVPGTNEALAFGQDCLQSKEGLKKFPVRDHFIDFICGVSGGKDGALSQLEYWESEKPNLREAQHPVQVKFAEQRFRYLERFIKFDEVKSAIDIGCGNGAGTLSLKKRVDTVFGLDMSEFLLSQMPEGIAAIRASGDKLPFRDKSVDFSMAWELIHHIEEPEGVFREMRRVSRKWVVIFEPNRWNPLQAGFSLIVSKERLGLRNTRRYLENLMHNAGLKIVHYACAGWIFPNKSPIWLAEILGRMPFKLPYIGISHLFIAEAE